MSTTPESEAISNVISLGKDIAEDIVRPTSKSIGNNLGLLIDGVMGWLGYWGKKQEIKRTIYLEDYKEKITRKISDIPTDNLIEPSIRVVGPAIEASKFFIEEEDCREMFANLIATSCNSEKAKSVHPSFPEIIKQLSPLDARFLKLFEVNNTYPVARIKTEHADNTITPYPHLLFDFKATQNDFDFNQQIELTNTVDNLIRFGLVHLNQEVIELGFDYNSFKCHWYYKAIEKVNIESDIIHINKYRMELTEFGKNFAKCCILGSK